MDSCKERSVEPGIVLHDITEWFAANSGVESVWILGRRVVAPNEKVLDLVRVNASSVRDHADCSVFIKSSHGTEVLPWDRWRVLGANESICVCWVANHADSDCLLCNLVDSLSLSLENLSICLQEISTLHAGSSWSRTYEHGHIGILEGNKGISCWDDLLNARVGPVLEFHTKTLEDLLSSWEFQKLQDNLLIWAEHATLTDEVAEECSDLASSASDCDSNGSCLQVPWDFWEVSSKHLKSRHEDCIVHCNLVFVRYN